MVRRKEPAGAAEIAVYGLAFACLSYLGLEFTASIDGVAAVRPEAGIFVAALLRTRRRWWPALTATFATLEWFGAVFVASAPLVFAIVLVAAGAGAALLAAWLIEQADEDPWDFAVQGAMPRLFVRGCAIPGLASAGVVTLGAAALTDIRPSLVFWSWLVPSCLGVLLMTPLMLTFGPDPMAPFRAMRPSRRWELLAVVTITGGLMGFAFLGANPTGAALADFAYVAFPLVFWPAMRLGGPATLLALAVLVPIAVVSDVADPDYTADVAAAFESTVALQGFLMVVVGLGLRVVSLQAQQQAVLDKEEASRLVLAQAEERFRSLFASAPVALRLLDVRPVMETLKQLVPPGAKEVSPHLAEAGIDARQVLDGAIVVESNRAVAGLVEFGSRAPRRLADRPTVYAGNPAVACEILTALAGGATEIDVSGDLGAADGETRYVQVKFIVPKQGGRPDYANVVVATIDVTDTEEARRRAEELSNLKSRLIASVAHELRTPLTAVTGFSSLLENDRASVGEAELDAMIADIAASARQMGGIVEDLLTAARADVGPLAVHAEPVPLKTEVELALRTTLVEGRNVTVSGNGVVAFADSGRVRQIVRNLVSNAVRYGADPIEVTIRENDEQAVVAVSDAGPELPPTVQDRLFELYWRSDSAPDTSLGVGLNLSRKMAQRMSGDLVFHRSDERNTFELRLPRPE